MPGDRWFFLLMLIDASGGVVEVLWSVGFISMGTLEFKERVPTARRSVYGTLNVTW